MLEPGLTADAREDCVCVCVLFELSKASNSTEGGVNHGPAFNNLHALTDLSGKSIRACIF